MCHQLNGKNTVGENIADNGGVREAHRAFQTYAAKNKAFATVPYMTKFSAEQLFFLSYANVSVPPLCWISFFNSAF